MKSLIRKILKENNLYNETDDKFKDWIGKRVCVPYINDSKNIKGETGKGYPNKGETICGILKFAGINKTHGKFQVTIDRMPLWPINPKDIKLQN